MKPVKFFLSFSILFFCSCTLFSSSKEESKVIKQTPNEGSFNRDLEKDSFQKKGFKAGKGQLPKFELARYQYCGDDRDCIIVSNGCCDCANGSPDVSINKDRLAAYEARFNCVDVLCGEKSVDPICGSGVVSCVNHKCKYFGPEEEDKK